MEYTFFLFNYPVSFPFFTAITILVVIFFLLFGLLLYLLRNIGMKKEHEADYKKEFFISVITILFLILIIYVIGDILFQYLK